MAFSVCVATSKKKNQIKSNENHQQRDSERSKCFINGNRIELCLIHAGVELVTMKSEVTADKK
jgi:hypothetical protein